MYNDGVCGPLNLCGMSIAADDIDDDDLVFSAEVSYITDTCCDENMPCCDALNEPIIDINNSTLTITPVLHYYGDIEVTVTVEDVVLPITEVLSDTKSFTLTVTGVNDAPTITSTAITEVDEDAAYSYTLTADDIDEDELVYAASTIPDWLSFDASSHILSGTPDYTQVGTHSVVLTVTESSGSEVQVSQSFTVTVNAVNDAPTAIPIAEISSSVCIMLVEPGLSSFTCKIS